MLERLFDHICVLRQIESTQEGNLLSTGMQDLKKNSIESLDVIMNIQKILLERYLKAGTLGKEHLLFWSFVGYSLSKPII